MPDTQPAGVAAHETYVRSRLIQLGELGRQDDPVSLHGILSKLTNSTLAIRQAALDAAVQFGSRDAIPALKQAAAVTPDPREKVAFLDAADYLELPSLTELREQIKPRKAGTPPRPRRISP